MLMRIKNLLVRFALPLAITFTVFIAVVSLIPPSNFPKTDISFSDKIAHTSCYAILSLLWCFAILRSRVKFSKTVLLLGSIILYGIFIEVLQDKLTTYRSFDYHDMIANTIGVAIGFMLFKIFQHRFVNLKES